MLTASAQVVLVEVFNSDRPKLGDAKRLQVDGGWLG